MDFLSSVEDVDSVTKKLKVVIPGAMVQEKVSQSLNKAVQKAHIKGFRPGKAPRSMVEKIHGDRVRYEVINDLISASLGEVVKEKDLKVIGSPSIDIVKSGYAAAPEQGETGEFEYTAQVSVYPEPEISNYETFSVQIPEKTVTDEDIDKVIQEKLREKAKITPITDRTIAANGDVFLVSIQVGEEGQDLSHAEDYSFEIGRSALPKEVEDGIIGVKVGESRSLTVTMPDDHESEAVRGKNITYAFTLKGLSQKDLPELTDEFVQTLEKEEAKTVAELKKKIRTRLEEEQKGEKESAIQAAVLDQLLERNTFEVPQVMVDEEIKSLLVRYGVVNPQQTDMEQVDVAPFREALNEAAIKRTKLGVAIDRLVEQMQVEISDEEFQAELGKMATQYGMPVSELAPLYQHPSRANGLKRSLSRDKVVKELEKRAKVTSSQEKKSKK